MNGEELGDRVERLNEGAFSSCLFCLRVDGGFAAVEHVLPESIGNTEIVLPRGVVCDRCNNGELSVLDQVLADFFPVKMQRTLFGIESKSGQVPTTRFSTRYMEHRDNDVYVALNGKPDMTSESLAAGSVPLPMNLTMSGGSPLTPRYCGRISSALLKIALECAWLEHGDRMLRTEFDHVRSAALGEPRDGYLAIAKNPVPDHRELEAHCGIVATDDGKALAVAVILYGVGLATHSRALEPAIAAAGDLGWVVKFERSDFRQAA